MAASELIRVAIDADVLHRASEVLRSVGMTVEQAIQEMLARTAGEGSLPFLTREEVFGTKDPEYHKWFCAQVQEALDDPSPGISSEEMERRMAEDRADFLTSKAKSML